MVINVVEGYIDSIKYKEETRISRWVRGRVRGYLRHVQEERPLNIKTLERYLMLANDAAGIKLKTVIGPSSDNNGASELTEIIQYKPAEASFAVDNSGSKYTGTFVKTYTASLNSLASSGDKLTITEVDGDPLESLRLRQFAFSMPIGNEGLALNLGVDHSTSRPGFTLQPVKIYTTSLAQNISLTYPIIRSRSQNLSVESGIKHKVVDTDLLGSRFTTDDLSYWFGRTSYDFSDRWDGSNVVALTLARGGVPWFNSSNLDSNSSRPEVKTTWDKYMLEMVRQQEFGDTGFGVTLAGNMQWTRSKLPAAEEFSVGGRNFGRGYDSGELTGDQGIAAKMELTYSQAPNQWWMDSYQFYGFYDMGQIWNLDIIDHGSARQQQALASTGIGARTKIQPWLGFDFEIAKPLTLVPGANSNENNYDEAKSPRIFMALRISY